MHSQLNKEAPITEILVKTKNQFCSLHHLNQFISQSCRKIRQLQTHLIQFAETHGSALIL